MDTLARSHTTPARTQVLQQFALKLKPCAVTMLRVSSIPTEAVVSSKLTIPIMP